MDIIIIDRLHRDNYIYRSFNMKIQERINSLSPYVVGMSFRKGYVIVDTQFKEKWVVRNSENIKSENVGKGVYRYFGSAELISVDDILDLIETIITHNLEREEKMDLLRYKAEELKILFAEKSLSELKRLTFSISEPDIVSELNLEVPEITNDVVESPPDNNETDGEEQQDNVEQVEEKGET